MIDFSFWYTIAILMGMTILLVKELIEAELVIFSALLLLVLGKIITPKEAFTGFSNSGMLTVGFLFIVAEALKQTGTLNRIGNFLLGKNQQGITSKLLRFLFPVASISAFFNNTPIVAMLIPTIHSWAKKNDYAISKFLIPLSYATILGGMCTLIGTSTNLVVHGLMIDNNMEGMSFFELTKISLPAAIFGLLYIALLGHRLLPDRKEPIVEFGENTREYVVELKVEPNFQHIGRSIEEAGLRHLRGLFLFQIERQGQILAPVGPDEVIQLGDRLFFIGLPATIIELQRTPGLSLLKDTKFDLKNYDSDELKAFEVVISPSSPLKGVNVRESNFRSRYQAVIIAIHRNGERIRKKIGDIILRPGDTLLILARHDFLKKWYNSNEFNLVSEAENIPSKPKRYAYFSASLFVVMILMMALEIIPIVITTAIIAVALILFKCISLVDAQKSVQLNVLLIIASAFGISHALENSGVAKFLAEKLILLIGSLGPLGILAGVYFMTSFYTEIITNNAAAALVFPIGFAAADQAGLDPRPFALAVAIGASASFATPIGYQTNLMVYGPGGYKFSDFLKIGIPMNILIGVIAILMIYFWYF
ncbi:MAG: SLC13 family permease [candidate division KSB1 bacterium]|nr:SLC13 family permease [candidate division KSB1 bacterium]MDZ7336778.1 SLC13 family permease [candidate division KSB1 bacterium]MDZ7358555.1 SLC13 family permease [candidate division KSB1 bacterium]MDZ7401645.1 SLC13 family permease [candidate division KSB1 bacterium]